jgi:hypothetical protein
MTNGFGSEGSKHADPDPQHCSQVGRGEGGRSLTSEELHELLLVHAVEKALELRVSEVAEVQAGRHSARRSRPPSNKRRS